MIVVKVKGLDPKAIMPKYAHDTDSGADIFALETVTIEAGQMIPLRTGLSVGLPSGYELQVRSKSGLAAKYGLFVLNSPGTIDQDYRGEILVLLQNAGKVNYTVKQGDKIAQVVLCPVFHAEFSAVFNLSETARGEGGFGSTGR